MNLRSLVSAALVVGAAGCFIATGDFTGEGCKLDEDCNRTGYVCVSSAKWPQTPCLEEENGCLCEIKFPPDFEVVDAGFVDDGGARPDAGSWCGDVKALFLRSCVGTCHNDNPVYPNAPKEFRLDAYTPPAAFPGVKDKLPRIKARLIDTRDMPPISEIIAFPFSNAERAMVDTWIRAGAPEGEGAPCDNDIFTNPDAGSDGGSRTDGGVDAGQVSFSTQIIPIFTARCGPCHTTNTAGQLSLTAANAYTQLVGPNATCNAAVRRVMPNNTQNSMLWRKLMNTADKCGNAMPNMTAGLAVTQPAEFARIQTWILQGAQNN
jgi:hypothetical protein